jgi:hypothetical protein
VCRQLLNEKQHKVSCTHVKKNGTATLKIKPEVRMHSVFYDEFMLLQLEQNNQIDKIKKSYNKINLSIIRL